MSALVTVLCSLQMKQTLRRRRCVMKYSVHMFATESVKSKVTVVCLVLVVKFVELYSRVFNILVFTSCYCSLLLQKVGSVQYHIWDGMDIVPWFYLD